jgi:hypothetical protein
MTNDPQLQRFSEAEDGCQQIGSSFLFCRVDPNGYCFDRSFLMITLQFE